MVCLSVVLSSKHYKNITKLYKAFQTIKEGLLRRKTTFDGRWPLTEDDLWQKTTFDRDDFWRKTTFDGRRPLTGDDPWWKMTFDGRRPLMEDDLWQKTTFEGRWPSREDDLWWKTTFDVRRPSIGLQYITWKKYFRLLTLTATAQLTPNRKFYQLSKPEKEFHLMEEMYTASQMRMSAEKTTFLGKDD